jgi:NADH:ubiquinone oxidoreductase subunit K
LLALSFRLGEGLLAAIAPLPTLGLLWLGTSRAGSGGPDAAAADALGSLLLEVRGWNTTISATLFAVGSTLFSGLFLRGRLIPVPLAWLGVVASILLVVGLPLQLVEVLDGTIVQLMWLPMAAFEIPLAFWLLIKGVRSPAPRPAG